MDPVSWFSSNAARDTCKLKCPSCTCEFSSGEDPENQVPRKIEPCGCVVCTRCATDLSSKPPYICPLHSQKLRMLEAHGTFPKAHNVVTAILFLDKLRRKSAVKAFPRSPVKRNPDSPSGPQSPDDNSRPLQGSFQVLIHFLGRFDSPRKQEVAVKALHDLSKHPISADELVSAGGIAALVQVLAASAPGLKWYAANGLKNCAAASPQGREAVERSGAISILVKQLAHDKWYTPGRRQVQEASVAALFELAADKYVSDKVVEAGGLKLLIKTMKKGTPAARALAAGTLGKLAIDIDLLVKIASRGNLPPLVRLRSTGMMPEVDEYSASLVSRMASLPATHEEMVKTHAVSHMMQDLARGSPRVQEAAVRGLASIASTQRRNGISVPGSPMKGASNTASPFKWTAQPRSDPTQMLNGGDHQQQEAGQPPLTKALESGYYSPLRANLANVVSSPGRRPGQGMLGPSNLGQSMQKMTLPMGTMSKAMASMTMTMRRAGAGLGTMRPMVESNDSGRLAGIAPDVATAGVPALLHMVRSGDPEKQTSALAILKDLAFSPEHRWGIVQAEGIPLLVDTLAAGGRGQEQASFYAASCLRSLALNEEWAEKMGEAGAVPLLVPMVSSEAEEGQDCAVGALANLAVNPRCRQLIADAQGIPPLIQLLSASGVGEGIREMAVGTLTNLAILPPNQVAIAAAGGILPLVKRLALSAPVAQANAAGALWSLAQDVDNQARIAHWGGISRLIGLLSSDSSAARMNAMGALRYLAENEDNRKLIKEGGGIAPLVRTFVASWGAAPELQEIACKCLLNLSISQENQMPIVEEGCLPAAVRFLLRGSLVAQEYSAGLILNLATNSRAQVAVAQSGAVAGLIKVLENGSSQAQGNAIEALRNLSIDPACCRQISQASQGKGIAIAVQQVCSLDVQTACHAACVVANLAACNQVHFHDSLQQAGALAPLVELLKCSLDEQSAALGALRNLTSDTLWQVGLAQSGAIPLIVQGLKHPDADARECAAAAVGNFAAGNCGFEARDGGEVQILGLVLDAIPSLVKQCGEVKAGPQDDCAASCAGALWRLMAADYKQSGRGLGVKNRINAVEGATALETLLKVGSSHAKDNAHNALEMLAAERNEHPRPPGAIPPTSPVEHHFGGKKRGKKSQSQPVYMGAHSSPIYTTATGASYRA